MNSAEQLSDDERPMLTVAQVAGTLHVSESTVRRMLLRGEMEAIRFGKIYRVRRSAFREYCESHQIRIPNQREGS